MRKLVLLVCVLTLALLTTANSGVIPSWEAESGNFGFYPIVNEISLYQNYDDNGDNRGKTIQIISINSFRLITDFNFEFTGDFNYDFTPGYDNDHYIELSIVKPIGSMFSLNVQRIIATLEVKSINQFGFRLSF